MEGVSIKEWQIGSSRFTACVELGARLMTWDIDTGTHTRHVLYWPSHTLTKDIPVVRGGNPILFPFSARTFHQEKENYWKTLKGDVLPMPRHGFARNGRFELTHSNSEGFTATFLPDSIAKESYPFHYTFVVTYRFQPLGLIVSLSLTNHEAFPICWSPGHHFYFELPWHQHLSRSDYRITLPAKKHFKARKDGTLAPVKQLPDVLDASLEELLDTIHTKLYDNTAILGPKNGEENIYVCIDVDQQPSAWSSFTTWTLDADSPFYCIEPWASPPNAPEHRKGLRLVNSNATDSFVCSVSL